MLRAAALAVGMLVLVVAAPAQDLLREDIPTTDTWREVRTRLPTHSVLLRNLVRQGGTHEPLVESLRLLHEDLEVVEAWSVASSSATYALILEAVARARRLSDFLLGDFLDGTDAELIATMDLMHGALLQIELLADQSDRESGRAVLFGVAHRPLDWGEPRRGDTMTRAMHSLHDARGLEREIAVREARMARHLATQLRAEDAQSAREVVELARLLSERIGEFPETMRPGVRNVALRLEVIAENMADHMQERDRGRARRQLLLLSESLRRLGMYLNLRDREQAVEF